MYIALFTTFVLLGFWAGLLLFPEERLHQLKMLKKLFIGLRKEYLCIGVLISIFILVKVKNIVMADDPYRYGDYTYWIYSIEGNAVLYVQSGLESTALTYALTAIYFYLFAYILLFTPFFFAFMNNRKLMRRYTGAMVIAYMIIIPFYFLFSVNVTSDVATGVPGMKQLLYSNTNHLRFVVLVDNLDDAFPSGHVAVAVLSYLISRDFPRLERYGYFLLVSIPLIIVSVVYLGVHWLLDIIAGALVGYFSFYIVRNTKFGTHFDNILSRIEGYFRRIFERAIPPTFTN